MLARLTRTALKLDKLILLVSQTANPQISLRKRSILFKLSFSAITVPLFWVISVKFCPYMGSSDFLIVRIEKQSTIGLRLLHDDAITAWRFLKMEYFSTAIIGENVISFHKSDYYIILSMIFFETSVLYFCPSMIN